MNISDLYKQKVLAVLKTFNFVLKKMENIEGDLTNTGTISNQINKETSIDNTDINSHWSISLQEHQNTNMNSNHNNINGNNHKNASINNNENLSQPFISKKSSSNNNIRNYSINNITLCQELFGISHEKLIPILWFLAFFVYYDRGGISAALNNIQEQLFDNNTFKGGWLATSYLIGFCVTSPIFALLGSYYPPLKMSAFGMFLWLIGAGLTGILSNFIPLLLVRLLTGIGEASFLAFVSTIIDVITPNESRALWLGLFYAGIPLGYGMGMILGGIINGLNILTINGNNQTWRGIFISEAILVLPLCIILGFCIKSPANMLIIKQKRDEYNGIMKVDKNNIKDDGIFTKTFRVLFNPTFLLISFAYSTQTFVTGAFGIEGITYVEEVFGWDSTKSGLVVGGATLITGIFGSLTGGMILDKMKNKIVLSQSMNYSMDNHNISDYIYEKPCIKLLIIVSILAVPFGLLTAYINNVIVFIICFTFCELMIFIATGPTNNAILWSVLYKDRPLAGAINTLFIHLFGDAMAPLIIGKIVDKKKETTSEANAYEFAISIAVWWLVLSSLFYIMSYFTLSWLKKFMNKYQNDDDNDGFVNAKESNNIIH